MLFRSLLIKPDIHVSTQEAYADVKPQIPEKSIKEIIQMPVKAWKDCLANDFERSVFRKYPEIGAIKNKLYEQGAVYASMSGSGSSVFGIFEKSIESWSDYQSYVLLIND